MVFKYGGGCRLVSSALGYRPTEDTCTHVNDYSGSIESWDFYGQLSEYQILRKEYNP
jgi:hypothetical protein